MKQTRTVLVAAALTGLSSVASADSLRCTRGIAAEGDTRMSVYYKCGEPLLKDSYCAPVYYTGSTWVVPPAIASAFVPCLLTEDWLYDRGPGNLLATVRFSSGGVQSITYGRTPR